MRRFVFFYLVFICLLCRCTNDAPLQREEPDRDTSATAGNIDYTAGAVPAEKYCQSCHLLPSPDLLDKKTWVDQVLPNMGARLGIRYNGYDPYAGLPDEDIAELKKLAVYPEKPILSEEEWKNLVNYYEGLAPQQLPTQNQISSVSPAPPPFSPQLIEIGDQQFPQVTLLSYDEGAEALMIGDHLKLYALDQQGNILRSWETLSPSSDIALKDEGIFLLSIGEFNPSNKKEGVFFPLTIAPDQKAEDYLITELPRPVDFAIGDLNGDGKEDVLICGFGHHQGLLAWYDHFQKNKSQVLSELPGARKAVIRDLNGDGRQDIMVLMAQAWEKVVIYYNTGGGKFREETVIELPAVYGSSYFELADLNQDGHPDILLTNGDNWDYSRVNKPYHGLRIYLNDGSGHFSEAYFFPMYGCSEARIVDFDKDGDLDIAAIAFYSEQADQSFVYLENQGRLSFTAHYLNESRSGRWLSMDVGDFNKDGYQDIFLGSYFHNINELGKLMYQGVEAFPEVLLLTYKQ
jgi:hypothetical protein